MRRTPSLSPLALTLSITLAAFAAVPAHAQSDTLKTIAERGKMTLAYRESSVPFSYLDNNNKPVGFSVEISNAIVEAVKKQANVPGLKVEFQPVTSQNRIPLLMNGTIDLECGSTTNNSARAKDVSFSHNIFYTGTRLLAKKSSKLKNYADLKDKTVASTTGTTNAQVIRKYNTDNSLNMNLILGKDHVDSMLLVESDRALAFAMDDILLFGLMANAKNPADWEVVADALQVEPYACMLRKDDPKFQAVVDGVIGGMMKSGEFEKLYNKWFNAAIPPKGINLQLPIGAQLRDNMKAPNNKPAL